MPALNANDPLPQLAPLGQPVGDNEGGVQEIYLLPQAALLRDPMRSGPSIVGELPLVAGAQFYPLRAVLDTASFDESFAQDRAQGLYQGKLAGSVASDSPALAAALLLYRNVRLVVLYRDRNGRLKLAGDSTSWYQLSYSLETQATAPGRNGYRLELTGTTLRPALFYGGPFAVAGSDGPSLGPGAGSPGATGTVQIFDHRGRLRGTAQPGQRFVIGSAFRTIITVED